jgi:hypothetical protein
MKQFTALMVVRTRARALWCYNFKFRAVIATLTILDICKDRCILPGYIENILNFLSDKNYI